MDSSAVSHLVVVALVTLCFAWGPSHTLVEASDDRVVQCWGRSANNLTAAPTSPPYEFIMLSASEQETCGLNAHANVQCWGSNEHGQGNVPAAAAYKYVSCGMDHTCTIDALGYHIFCWGATDKNQTAPPSDEFDSISCGYWHSCGIRRSDQQVICWGDNSFGQLNVPTTEAFLQVAAGWRHTCGLRSESKTIACWGSSNDTSLTSPPTNHNFTKLGVGYNHSCALDSQGIVHCWGSNLFGQTNAPPLGTYVDLAVGAYFSCALSTANSINCWGDNSDGQQDTPGGYSGWNNITAGHYHMCGIGVPPSPSPTPAGSPSTSPSASASPSTSPSTSPSPSASPSPPPSASPFLGFVPITVNVSATFGGDSPIVDVTAPLPSSSSSGSSIRVRSELSQLQANNSDVSNIGWTVVNAGGDNTSASVLYSAILPGADSTTSVNQSYAFYKDYQATQFSGLNFTITAGAVKWSINLTNSDSSSPAPGLRFAYRLTTNATQDAAAAKPVTVTVLRGQPRANMTTYRVPYGYANVVVEVQLFDVALVDGELAYINHSLVQVVSVNSSSSAAYDVVLSFPPFARSLEYDPSIGLGLLLGSSSPGDGGGGGSDNTGLIVGVAVAVPVAVALVLVVIVGALVYGYYRRRQVLAAGRGSGSIIHFANDRDSDDSL